MFFIDERLKDALKVLVIITPFVFVVVRGRKMIKTDKRLFILIAGFTFVTLGFLSDFVDEFAAFQYVPVFGSAWPFHELIEDIFGVVGFLLFGVGVGAEISYM
ncbi:MAG: hypothetical protein ABH825_02930 [Candidatus Omnitrophota bacterium]